MAGRVPVAIAVIGAAVLGFVLGRASTQADPATQAAPRAAEQTPPSTAPVAQPDPADATEVANHLLDTAPSGAPVGEAGRRHVGTWSAREPYEAPADPEPAARAMPPVDGTRVPLERVTRLTLTADGGARLLRYITRLAPAGQAAPRKAMGFATELRGRWTSTDGSLAQLELQGVGNPWVEGMPVFKARDTGELARMERVPKERLHALLLMPQGEPETGAVERRTLSVVLLSVAGGDLQRASIELERASE